MIAFYTIANDIVGVGNLSRCATLAQDLQIRGYDVKLFVEGDENLTKSFSTIETYCFLDKGLLWEKLKLVIDECNYKQPERCILVLDLPVLEDEVLLENLKKLKVFKVVSLNDQFVQNISPDIYINSDDVMEIQDTSIQKYIGPQYQLIRQDLSEFRPSSVPKVKKIQNISFIFGGSDPGFLIEDTIRELSKRTPSFDSMIVLGPGMKEKRKERILEKSFSNIIFLNNPFIPDVIAQSDVVVTMGGMTSYEAMFIGKPVLAVEWEHMAKYVKYMHKHDLLFTLGDRTVFMDNLMKKINFLDEIQSIVEKSFFTIDGKGNRRISDIIEQSLN